MVEEVPDPSRRQLCTDTDGAPKKKHSTSAPTSTSTYLRQTLAAASLVNGVVEQGEAVERQ